MEHLNDSTVRVLGGVAGVIVPGFRTLGPDQRAEFFSIIDAALADRPESVRRQLSVFVRVLDLAPVLRWGRRLGRLEPERANRVLRWFQEAPVDRLRKGFWGLKTLVFMGYYGRGEAAEEIGYRPDFDGRSALNA